MNNQEPLNDQYWDDLSLPNQDLAWEDMKSRLDERKSRRMLFFPLSFAGCALLSGIVAIAGITGWFFLHGQHHSVAEAKQTAAPTRVTAPAPMAAPSETAQVPDPENTPVYETHHFNIINNYNLSAPNTPYGAATKARSTSGITTTHNTLSHTEPGSRSNSGIAAKDNRNNTSAPEASIMPATPATTGAEPTMASDPVQEVQSAVKADSTAKKDSTQAVVIRQPEKKQHYHFSAGLGATQQISIKGQEQVRYNALGKDNVLSDYTPSVYFKLERDNRWFIMLEGRLNAPQAVKSFAFARQTTGNPSNYHLTVNEKILRKTYYHQIPISFNYYVAPGLSVGAGVVYQRFHAAVWENSLRETDVASGLVMNSSNIEVMKGYRDSFLYKTQLQSLLQVNYQWHRWMLGLRYTYDLQPYIRFTKPDGTIVSEKNSGLLFQLRFRLFEKGL